MREDWDLIEQSFAAQYHIRLRETTLPWEEFATFLSGLLPETPFGRIISIRSEKDPKVIKAFNATQKKIYRDWQIKSAKESRYSEDELNKQMAALSSMLSNMFGKGGGKSG